jgi:ferredoxin
MCAHLAPDLVRLDSWGYPVVDADPASDREQRQAARAAAGCPRRALQLTGPAR